jgi:hypothetical protein
MKIAMRKDEVTGQADDAITLQNLTTAARNALTAADGMMIFNTDTNDFEGYSSASWGALGGGGGGGGTPGGVDHDVQINDASAFGVADGTFKFRDDTNSMVFGNQNSGSLTPSTGQGTLVHGEIRGTYSASARIQANVDGANAQGVVQSDTQYGYARIEANADGCHAGGMALTGAGAVPYEQTAIKAEGNGALAHGYVTSVYEAQMRANARGAVALGCLVNTGSFRDGVAMTGDGSGFVGYAKDIPTPGCTVTGKGALLLGRVGNDAPGSIKYATVSANGALQVGNGVNAEPDSLAVGENIRLNAATGVPVALRNGDFWVNANYVYVRSNGVSVKLT